MKYFLAVLIIGLGITAISFGQSVQILVKKADSLYTVKDYQKSFEVYQQAINLGDTNFWELYDGARSAALVDKKTEAFIWLNLAFDKGYRYDWRLKADSNFICLHKDSIAWYKLIDKAKQLVEKDKSELKEFMYTFKMLYRVLDKYGYMGALDSALKFQVDHRNLSMAYPQWSALYQVIMTAYSYAGDNNNSIIYQEKCTPRLHFDPINNFKMVDAEKYIIDHYSKKPVIMINEAHNRGQCRAFVRDMLPALYKAGYRYLAAESFNYTDTTLNQRKYPVQHSGTYVREPVFGQLVRDAMVMGFTCIPYEDSVSGNRTSNDRDEAQAENIYHFMKTHPSAKVIICAGHDHIFKQHKSDWILMGERLCKKLGHDIPSIETTSLVERYSKDAEGSVYRSLADSMKVKTPSIILVNDTPYVVPKLKGFVDVSIYLPPTNYDLGYPDWMKESKDSWFNLFIPQDSSLGITFIQVYNADEYDKEKTNAIPVMQFPTSRNTFKLYLKKGRHYAFVYGKDNELLTKKEFSVE